VIEYHYMLCEGEFGEQVEPVQLIFDQAIPDFAVGAARAAYRLEAARLADALWEALPGGVVDQLAAELLSRVATRLKVGLEPVNRTLPPTPLPGPPRVHEPFACPDGPSCHFHRLRHVHPVASEPWSAPPTADPSEVHP